MARISVSGQYFIVSYWSGDTFSWEYGDTPIYCAYNQNNGDHIFTASWDEYQKAVSSGWFAQGVQFRTSSNAQTPVYRLYNKNNGQHVFTANKQEYENLKKVGLTDEGIAFKVSNDGNYEVYRYYRDPYHYYTPDPKEGGHLASIGWTHEGVAFKCMGIVALSALDHWYGTYDPMLRSEVLDYSWQQTFIIENKGENMRITNAYTKKQVTSTNLSQSYSSAYPWQFEQVGTKEIAGQVCPVVVMVNGGASPQLDTYVGGTATQAATNTSENKQKFLLVKRDVLTSGGLYQVLSYANQNLALDVQYASKTTGTRFRAEPKNGGNNQKFLLHKETQVGNNPNWVFRDTSSGQYMTLSGAADKTGKVAIYPYSTDANRRWQISIVGTTTVKKTTCPVVCIFPERNTNLMLSVPKDKGNSDIQLQDGSASNLQKWILVPTTATDPNVPTPQKISLGVRRDTWIAPHRSYATQNFYPQWYCTDAWMQGNNSYIFAWRTRYMRNFASDFGAWSSWNYNRTPHLYTAQGGYAALYDGMSFAYDTNQFKCAEYQFGVQCVGTGEGSRVQGQWGYGTSKVFWYPVFSATQIGFGVDGLIVGFQQSRYKGGNSIIYITGIVVDGKNILSREYKAETGYADTDGSVTISYKDINNLSLLWSAAGAKDITVMYQPGCDVWARCTWQTWQFSARAQQNTGTHSMKVSYEQYAGRSLLVRVENLGTTRLSVSDEKLGGREIQGFVSGKDTCFVIEYPFGYDLSITASSKSNDGDAWAVYHKLISKDDNVLGKPCHAFSWHDGGVYRYFLLEMRQGQALSTKKQISKQTNKLTLLGREYASYTYSGNMDAKFDAEGAYIGGHGTTVTDTLEDAQKQGHVVYRAPSGDIANVAITSISWERNSQYTTVSVSMEQESL